MNPNTANLQIALDWLQAVVSGRLRQIREIEIWICCNATLMNDWGMKKKIKPGFRTLFYGPPGTGKTLTASLLGKQTGKDIFRIDLSRGGVQVHRRNREKSVPAL